MTHDEQDETSRYFSIIGICIEYSSLVVHLCFGEEACDLFRGFSWHVFLPLSRRCHLLDIHVRISCRYDRDNLTLDVFAVRCDGDFNDLRTTQYVVLRTFFGGLWELFGPLFWLDVNSFIGK